MPAIVSCCRLVYTNLFKNLICFLKYVVLGSCFLYRREWKVGGGLEGILEDLLLLFLGVVGMTGKRTNP